MRAKTINEMDRFRRGGDPRKTLGIGMTDDQKKEIFSKYFKGLEIFWDYKHGRLGATVFYPNDEYDPEAQPGEFVEDFYDLWDEFSDSWDEFSDEERPEHYASHDAITIYFESELDPAFIKRVEKLAEENKVEIEINRGSIAIKAEDEFIKRSYYWDDSAWENFQEGDEWENPGLKAWTPDNMTYI